MLIFIDFFSNFILRSYNYFLIKNNKRFASNSVVFKFVNDISAEMLSDSYAKDDSFFLFGCSIINELALHFREGKIFNIHTSILPDYRNVYSEFWALRERAYSKIGVTLHVVTNNLDKGPIIAQRRIMLGEAEILPEVVKKNLAAVESLLYELSDGKLNLSERMFVNNDGCYRNAPGAWLVFKLLFIEFCVYLKRA